jgi:ComF family protein
VITEMKYGDKPGLAAILAPYLSMALADSVSEDAVLIPVPMHPSKKRERGYNQSELLSGLLAEGGGWTSRPNLLVKKRNTASQTTLQREARPANVAGSFGVKGGSDLNGRRVVIVDDVVTTGSTLVECAQAIRELDAGEISACVVASSLQ